MTEPIRNVPAEKQVLGALMQAPVIVDKVFSIVSPDDFAVSSHADLASVLYRRHLAGEPLTPTAVMTALTTEGNLSKIGGGPYLFELVQQLELPLAAPKLAEDVHRCYVRRSLIEVGTRLVQQAENDMCEPLTVSTKVQAELADVVESELVTSNVAVPTLRKFLDTEDDEVNWVLPGLLARDDRMILTGSEGIGKMMLLRQIAVCAGAGLDPFKLTPIEPQTVLLVDLENPAQIMRQTLRKIAGQAQVRSQRHDLRDRLFVERRPEGLNLANPADVAWLMKRVTLTTPDILIIGPIYKLIHDNPNDEQVARTATVALDLIRTHGRCALLLEAHSGHAAGGVTERPIRPIGSSLWMRWPEFGLGLRFKKGQTAEMQRAVDLVSWRGARGERNWPHDLIGSAQMPFVIDHLADNRSAA